MAEVRHHVLEALRLLGDDDCAAEIEVRAWNCLHDAATLLGHYTEPQAEGPLNAEELTELRDLQTQREENIDDAEFLLAAGRCSEMSAEEARRFVELSNRAVAHAQQVPAEEPPCSSDEVAHSLEAGL